MQAQSRPVSVILLGITQILTGAIFMLGGGALLTFAGSGSPVLRDFGLTHIPIALSFILLGILSLFVSRKWVRSLGLAVVVVSVVDDLLAYALAPLPLEGVIGTTVVLITALIVGFCLSRTDVRSFFRGRASDHR
jgi:hypothetical protein